MLLIFDTEYEYNTYTSNNTKLDSGVLYFIKENNTAHIYTNNIDGSLKIYNLLSL